eukprot:922055_1
MRLKASHLNPMCLKARSPNQFHPKVSCHLKPKHPEYSHLKAKHPEYSNLKAKNPEYSHLKAKHPEYSNLKAKHPEYSHLKAKNPEYSHLKAKHPEYSQSQSELPGIQQSPSEASGIQPSQSEAPGIQQSQSHSRTDKLPESQSPSPSPPSFSKLTPPVDVQRENRETAQIEKELKIATTPKDVLKVVKRHHTEFEPVHITEALQKLSHASPGQIDKLRSSPELRTLYSLIPR